VPPALGLPVLLQGFVQRSRAIKIGYNWHWKGTAFHPEFDIRNRFGSRTYLPANISYLLGGSISRCG
jgi:hypothetical protein